MSRASISLLSLPCLLLSSLVLLTPARSGPAKPAALPAPQIPANIICHEDVTYQKVGPTALLLDIAYPKNAKGRLPTVVLLGGAGPLAKGKVVLKPMMMTLAENGYVAVAVGYRHQPKGEHLAPIHDAKAAVRWLRTQVKNHPIDPDRIGAVGYSVGCSLACLLGMTNGADGLEGPVGPNAPPSHVKAVVGFFGPSDMKALHKSWMKGPNTGYLEQLRLAALQSTAESWMGGSPTKYEARYTQLSTINYVRKEIAPMLLMHGTLDNVIPVAQSLELVRQLREKKAPINLLLFDNAPHDFDMLNDLNARLANAALLAFLNEHLGKS
jgi:acetyl esterase/lipase